MSEGLTVSTLFSLFNERALIVGAEGNLGPIWKEAIEAAGGTVRGVSYPDFDATDLIACQHLSNQIGREDGKQPTIIVYNAAIDNPPGSKAHFFGGYEEIVRTNLLGAVNIANVFMPAFVGRGSGTFVFIGSIQGYIGADWRNYPEDWSKPVGYNLSKAGLQQLARSITVQYGRYGVRAVCPGFGAYDGGKLSQEFLGKFLRGVPMGRTVSRKSLMTTMLYACCCPELAGENWLVDGGYTAW